MLYSYAKNSYIACNNCIRRVLLIRILQGIGENIFYKSAVYKLLNVFLLK